MYPNSSTCTKSCNLITYFLSVYTVCRVIPSTPKQHQVSHLQVGLPFAVVTTEPSSNISQNLRMHRAIELGCTAFIVDEDSAIQFLDSYIPVHDGTIFRRPEKYIILSIHSIGPAAEMLLRKIQQHPAIEEIANLLLVVTNSSKIDLLTHRYVGNLPKSRELILLDSFRVENQTFDRGSNLFPDKLSNLMGKRMRVATFQLLPWSMMRQADDGIVRYLNQSYTIDGLDGYILIQFCLWYNCTWDLSVDQENQYGVVFENHTGNGMIGSLVERKVDVAIGAVGAWASLFQYFSFSNPIMWIGVTSLAPRPRLIPSWKIVFMMFTKTVWFLLIATYILIVFFDYYLPKSAASHLQYKKSLSRSFLNVFGAFLLLPSELRRGRISENILSISLLVVTFLVGYVYIGKIHSILAVPVFQPPIDTIYDLAMSNKHWNAPHEAWMYALIGSLNPYVQKILSTFKVTPIDELKRIADEGDEALVFAVLNFGHFMVGPWFTAENIENYRLMSELIYFEYDTAYASKTWPLLDRFDYLTGWIRDACLCRYVELVDVYHYMNYRVQISIEHSRDKPHNVLKPFGVDSIEGGLLMLGCGYLAALAALIFEIFTRKLEKQREIAKRLAGKWRQQIQRNRGIQRSRHHQRALPGPNDEKDAFYARMKATHDSCSPPDITIVIRDMNAMVGREEMCRPVIGSHSLHVDTTDDGQRCIYYAASSGRAAFPLDEILNLLILLPTVTQESIDILTHNYAVESRQTRDLLLLDSYDIGSEKFRYGSNLLPDKMANLQGKTIRVATFTFIPYMVYKESEPSFPLVQFDHQALELDCSEGLILTQFCGKYNCTLDMIIDEETMWGDVYDNKTGKGILGNLVERRADIGPTIVKLLSRFEVHPPDELERMADKGDVAFCMGRQQNGHLVFGSWITDRNAHQYQLLVEDLYFVYHVAMATKTWPLMERFNEMILRTTDASVRYYQELVAYNKYLNPYINNLVDHARRRTPKEPSAVVLKDFLGAVIILGFGTTFGVIVFLVELLIARFATSQLERKH
ncbi:uncharacterized protein LOC128739613 [Sabethes cyaneus]|uniref:uncharacterized protein LOC128739613 n=1 Tax=Sabethes cyaneus TaxID=53552 RepID=UPI00237DA610|nr:uncharacterized protein LOC128739613 [Sabethes cyaneus]